METEQQEAGTATDEISGLIRRVRRLAKWSQRELAHELGVSQSAVAKWETGRTTPSARMLARVLELAELSLAAVSEVGDRVQPMKRIAARDAAGRRYPAHTFVWPEGWWAPEGAETTAWMGHILCRSEDLELVKVRYSRWWGASRRPTLADIHEHPTWAELVAEAREGWRPPRRKPVPIPEWAFADTHKSRNRRPEEFRALARVRAGGVETRVRAERMRQ
jgi:transcriptional regulator with XRE-family HTH domain